MAKLRQKPEQFRVASPERIDKDQPFHVADPRLEADTRLSVNAYTVGHKRCARRAYNGFYDEKLPPVSIDQFHAFRQRPEEHNGDFIMYEFHKNSVLHGSPPRNVAINATAV
jgi:hypothetical protein